MQEPATGQAETNGGQHIVKVTCYLLLTVAAISRAAMQWRCVTLPRTGSLKASGDGRRCFCDHLLSCDVAYGLAR